MHGRVQFARNNCLADFGNECAALASMLQQLAGLIRIACGFELDDLDINVGRDHVQAAGNFLGLGQRHDALARADPYSTCHYLRSFDAAQGTARFRREDKASLSWNANASNPVYPRRQLSSRLASSMRSCLWDFAGARPRHLPKSCASPNHPTLRTKKARRDAGL